MCKEGGAGRKVYLHAEIAALVRVRDWSKIERMTVVRLGAYGQGLNAKPCPVCQEAIKQAGVKYVEHT